MENMIDEERQLDEQQRIVEERIAVANKRRALTNTHLAFTGAHACVSFFPKNYEDEKMTHTHTSSLFCCGNCGTDNHRSRWACRNCESKVCKFFLVVVFFITYFFR